jgi:hypothetical protein
LGPGVFQPAADPVFVFLSVNQAISGLISDVGGEQVSGFSPAAGKKKRPV